MGAPENAVRQLAKSKGVEDFDALLAKNHEEEEKWQPHDG
jgi:hypothetical protein